MTVVRVIRNASAVGELKDWGPQPGAIDGRSMSSGLLLHKGLGGQPECGLWVCSPGSWRLSVPRDEFCHFVAGRCTYVGDDGERIAIAPGTVVHFPAGWSGRCIVEETIRNVYMLC